MTEPHIVAHLMRNRFGDVGFRVGEVVVVNPPRPIGGVAATGKYVNIGNATGTRGRIPDTVGICIPSNQRMRGSSGKRGWPLGRDVNVEWAIIFSYAFPDPFDRGLFGVTVSGKIGICTERH